MPPETTDQVKLGWLASAVPFLTAGGSQKRLEERRGVRMKHFG